jgi:hypothetical protein
VLRQLERLLRPLPRAGERAAALAVYADEAGEHLAAAEQGFEGVACVDDAARGLVLYSDLWERTRSARCRERAEALLAFVLYLEDAEGRFANFVHDWAGSRNGHGPTSVHGGPFWQARALLGLAHAARALDDESAHAAAARALRHVPRDAAGDVRAIHALAALELGREDLLERWSDEIAACRSDDVLLDAPDAPWPHLWGHLQEGVLAEAAMVLRRRDLLERARRSAELVIVPAIESRFDLPTVQPYGVASAAFAMDRLASATGEERYRTLAADARAWFDGRNTANAPVYDRVGGRVFDGIDHGIINAHSGAESNVVGAQTLIDELAARLLRDEDACFRSAPSSPSWDNSSASS